jgi:hypothetical protein
MATLGVESQDEPYERDDGEVTEGIVEFSQINHGEHERKLD